MIWLLICIWFCYLVLIIGLAIGFNKVKEFTYTCTEKNTRFSVIVPFRNEAKNLPVLLQSITTLNYPRELFEVIFVNDFSEDNSVEIIEKFLACQTHLPFVNYCILKNNRTSKSPKKDAITTAITQSKYNWIVTTDADCKLPKKWLTTLDNFIQNKKPTMVISAVNYKVNNSFLERFQLLDFLSLQGTTIGGFGLQNPFLCNGANLAYKKDIFLTLNGFKENNHIASGDDVFIFEKFLQHHKKSVHFLKSTQTIVTTFPVKNWVNLFHQRVRWASKTSQISSLFVKLIGLIVFSVNLSLVLGLFVLSKQLVLSLFFIKFFTDLFLFLPTVTFFKQQNSFLKSYIFCSVLYPFFSVLVVLYSLFFKFEWKGRRFKH